MKKITVTFEYDEGEKVDVSAVSLWKSAEFLRTYRPSEPIEVIVKQENVTMKKFLFP